DEHDIVYRAAVPGPSQPPARGDGAAAPGTPGLSPGRLLTRRAPLRAGFLAGPVALQRFSAATSNAHRIHYDHLYVTRVEGYPGLLVHGTLLLLSLLELVRLDLTGREVTQVAFRARSPVFAGDQVELAGELTGGPAGEAGAVSLSAAHTDGRVA